MSGINKISANVDRKNRLNKYIKKPARHVKNIRVLKYKCSNVFDNLSSYIVTKNKNKYIDEKLQEICEDRYQKYLSICAPECVDKKMFTARSNEDYRYLNIFEDVVYTENGPIFKTKKLRFGEKEIGYNPLDEEIVIYEGLIPDKNGAGVYTIARAIRVNNSKSLREIRYDIIKRDKHGRFHHSTHDGIMMMKSQDKTEYCDDFRSIANYYAQKSIVTRSYL